MSMLAEMARAMHAPLAGGPSALFSIRHALERTSCGKWFRATRACSRRWDTDSSTTRKSARATSPESVYSQRCPATCGSRLADISSGARPKPKLVDLRHGRDSQDGHHAERPPGSLSRRHDPYIERSH